MKKLREYELWTPLREKAIEQGLDPAAWELAQAILEKKAAFTLEDNEIVHYENGKPSGTTPDEFFRDVFSVTHSRLYLPKTLPGAGTPNATTSGGTKNTMTRAAFEQLSPVKQAEFIKKGGSLV